MVDGVVNQVKDTVSGQLRNLFNYIKSSPSSTATNLTVPANAEIMAFDFRFTKPGAGDWLTVSFNDTLLFSFLGSDFVGSGYQHVVIPVGHIAGETGVLTVRLNDSGADEAEVLVSNFQFLAQDTTPPAAVTQLATGAATTTTIELSWPAPGGDGSSGMAASYDIRYSTSGVITENNWASATPVTGEPAPLVVDSLQTFTVSGLSCGTTYFFALKSSDEVPNVSLISNSPSIATLPCQDIVAPAAVTNLATGTATTTSVPLSWAAPGDDGNSGTATSYDIRYTLSPITEANWASATQVGGAPVPLPAGSAQNFTVPGLSCGTTYFFALKTSDEVPNTSSISNSPTRTTLVCSDILGPNVVITSHTNNQIVITSPITVSGTASDSGLGNSGISSVTVKGVAATGGTATGSGTANWNSQSVALIAGINTIIVEAKDASANQNSTQLQISVNYQPPNQAPDSTIVSPAANVTIATGRSVNYQGSGSDPDKNLPLSYAWNFGGGAPNSSAQNPGLVTFNTQGIYTVTFTVMDNLKLSDPTPPTRTITVISPAAVVFVEPSGACNGNTPCFTSIQQAIGVVAAGGTIRVAQSTYRENLLVDSALSFTLEGGWSSNFLSRSNNPALTIIDGDLTGDGVGEASVFTIQVANGIHASVTINRFTMQHGNDDEGGGVFAFSANGGSIDLTLTGNVIRQNKSTNTGAGVGIYAQDAGSTANATLTNNMISGNDATGDVGGVYAIADNNGQVTLNLINNTITDNTSTLKGGGLRAVASNGGIAGLTLKNSIVWGNTASAGQDIAIRQESSGSATINASYSDIGDVSADSSAPGTFNDLGNNIDADPLFVNFVGGDLHLASGWVFRTIPARPLSI